MEKRRAGDGRKQSDEPSEERRKPGEHGHVHVEFYGDFVLRAAKSPAGSVARSIYDKYDARSIL